MNRTHCRWRVKEAPRQKHEKTKKKKREKETRKQVKRWQERWRHEEMLEIKSYTTIQGYPWTIPSTEYN